MTLTRRTFAKLAGAAAGGLVAGTSVETLAQDERPLLRFAANASDVFNLDPHFSTSYQDWMIRDMVFNALIRYTPGDISAFEPDLAVEMPTAQENDDGTQTWTFALREDVVVHPTEVTDSYILTSEDVRFSLEKMVNPETSTFAADHLGWTFEAPDEFTITITVPQPLTEALFFPKIANYLSGFIVPKQPYEAIGREGFIMRPTGTGPFQFSSHTPQNNVTLTANDDYFRGPPKLGGIEMRFIADTTSRELALQSGDLDVIHGIPDSRWANRIDEMENITVDVFGAGDGIVLNLDTEHEILSDIRVRQAILHAINREEHAALAGERVSTIMYSVAPHHLVEGGLTRDEAEEAGVLYPYNPDQARALLSEAGYPEGFELSLVTSELPLYRKQYEVLAHELGEVGIEVTLEVVQHAAMHQLIREGRNALVFYATFRPNVDFYLTHYFSSESNLVNFSKFTVDDLILEARAELDPERQVELWKQALIEIQANAAATGLCINDQVYAHADYVDYGYDLQSSMNAYPNINELTTITSEE